MVLKMKNLNFTGVFTKKPIQRGDWLERGAWTVFRFKRGRLRKEGRSGVFDRGLILQCPLSFMFTYNFLTYFFLFFIDKNVFSLFSFLLGDEISNICDRILTNQKAEQVIRNFLWNCTCNSSLINIRGVSLPPCQLPKVDLGQPIQIQLMGSAGLWDPT